MNFVSFPSYEGGINEGEMAGKAWGIGWGRRQWARLTGKLVANLRLI